MNPKQTNTAEKKNPEIKPVIGTNEYLVPLI